MQYKIGNDVTRISRFEDKITKTYFVNKVLSQQEIGEYLNLDKKEQVMYLAKRWAFKEAYLKMNGWGIEHIHIFKELTLVNKKNQKPYVEGINVDVSISHDGDILFVTCCGGEHESKYNCTSL